MNDDMYNILSNHPSYSWLCDNCGMPNFSTTFVENLGGFDLSNSFDLLNNESQSHSFGDLDASNLSKPSDPIYCSSPKADRRHSSAKPNKATKTKPKHVTNLKIINMNCRSVRANLPTFEAVLATQNPDIVIGTESWLNNSIASGEVFPSYFNVFRHDRQTSEGGGVFIAVKNTLVASVECKLQTDCEILWISICVKGLSPVYVGAFYRPQSTDTDYVKELDSSLSKIPPNASIWLLGDFNIPDIDWEAVTFKSGGQYPAVSKLMIDIVNDYNLHQLVKKPTRDKNILDLCLTNTPAAADFVNVESGTSDHDMVVVGAILKPKISRPPKRKIFLYAKGNFAGIDDDMKQFYEENLHPNTAVYSSVEELYTSFKNALSDAIDKHIPSKTSSSHFSYPWVNNSIKRDINRKKRLYNNARKHGSASCWARFRKLRRQIDRKIRKAHGSYIREVIGASLKSDNTRPFWNFIKSKRKEVSGVSPLNVANNIISSAKGKAEALNHQFCSVFTKENQINFPDLGSSKVPDIGNLIITTEGVEKLLSNLNPHKASGPDGITARVLKSCSASIAPILQNIFQRSVSTGDLPTDWLNANISPIYKKSDRTNPANYRPVSLTSIVCKTLEHVLYGHIMKHFEKYNILVDQQHGFRKGRSCETQLSTLVNDLHRILDNRSQADLVIMDFSKAFDTVPHRRLMAKLQHVGIRNNILSWIETFLTKRYQQVVVDGEFSQCSPVESGVPQGTVLGPLLFLVYINDLPDNLSSSVRLFADDCIVYREIKGPEDAKILQNDVNHLCNWETKWQMGFNYNKCYSMRVTHKIKPIISQYRMGDSLLEEVNHHPYLGVELTSDLTWNKHINQITLKANRTLGLLKRNLSSCDKSTKEVAYKALVRPLLEYCQTVWDPHQKNTIDEINKVQRRAARFVSHDYAKTSSVSEIINKLSWEPRIQTHQSPSLYHLQRNS